MPETTNTILTLIFFMLILGILVFVHELGHFLAAKLSGVKVEEFAFGFGKKLWSREFKGTLYRINLLPFGGYVKLQGENFDESDDRPGSYASKPLYKKIFILMAGIMMNMLLAFVFFGIYLTRVDYKAKFQAITTFDFVGTETTRVMLNGAPTDETSPAYGIIGEKDVIVSLNGAQLKRKGEFLERLQEFEGREIQLGLVPFPDFNATPREVTVRLRDADEQKPLLGFSYAELYELTYPNSFFSGVPHSINALNYQVSVLGNYVERAFAERDAGIVLEQVGGLIAVGSFVGMIVTSDQFVELINLTALLSIALAFFNILPIPLLDGGQAVIEILQSLTRRRIPQTAINVVNNITFILLILLTVLISFKDAIQFSFLENIISGIRSVLGR